MPLRKIALALGVVLILPVAVYAAATLFSANPPTINWKKDSVQSLQLTSNASLIFKNGKVGETYKLVVRQDATGGRTITWPSDVKWSNGVAPTLTSVPNAIDIAEFLFDGTSYLGSFKLNFTGNPPPPPPTTLNDGLIHYWKLDESSGNAIDSVGTLTLTNNNNTPFDAGRINNGVHINDSNLHYISTTNDLVASEPTAYSACAWINLDSVPPGESANDTIFISYDTNLVFQLYYFYDAGTNSLQLRYDHVDNTIVGHLAIYNTVIATGDWHHVCGTWTDPAMTLYFDGTLVATQNSSGNADGVSNGTQIGASFGPSALFDGKIDEVGFWTRALSSTEVSQLYNGGTGIQYPF